MSLKFLSLGMALTPLVALAQTQLSLEQAISMAMARNGDVKSALHSLESAKAQLKSAQSAFLPNVSANFDWVGRTGETYNSPLRYAGWRTNSSSESGITASYRILDNGRRALTYRSAADDAESVAFQSRQTMRQTLFGVIQQYYEALRAQQLLRVNEEQTKRAKQQLDATKVREKVGAGPRKDILQSEADYLNAETNVLLASNQVDTTRAALRATIGIDGEEAFPELVDSQAIPDSIRVLEMASLKRDAVSRRSDLQSARKRLSAAQSSLSLRKLERGVQWTLDARVNRGFSPVNSDLGQLLLSASVPLYDGKQSKSAWEAERESILAQQETIVQAERAVRAEVESAAKTYSQLIKVRESASLALAAAKQNYEVALKAQELGKFNLLELESAQVSLTNAEANFVGATYDFLIAEARLKLVLGEPLPGEINLRP